jgi:microcystin-dependent protein
MDTYLGEIRIFAGNFAPAGWAFCNGQLLAINQNMALYSLLGVTYGGNGVTTFALPDLRGRFPMHAGAGNGLSQRLQGQQVGSESVTLTEAQLPGHVHNAFPTSDQPAVDDLPAGNVFAAADVEQYGNNGAAVPLEALGAAGQGAPHNNLSPYLCLNFIIALQGDYPQRP